jgi:hypothetical protein
MPKEKLKKVLTLPKEVIQSGIFHKTRKFSAQFFTSKSSASECGFRKEPQARSKALPGGRRGAKDYTFANHSFHRKELCSDRLRFDSNRVQFVSLEPVVRDVRRLDGHSLSERVLKRRNSSPSKQF